MSQTCSNCGKELTPQEIEQNPKTYKTKTDNVTTTSSRWLCSNCHKDQVEHRGAIEK